MESFQIQAILEDIGNKLAQQSKNEIINQTLAIWSKLGKEYSMEGDIKLSWPALDPRFEPGTCDAVFRQWWDRGITAVCTITHRGLLKSLRIRKQFFFPLSANQRFVQ